MFNSNPSSILTQLLVEECQTIEKYWCW